MPIDRCQRPGCLNEMKPRTGGFCAKHGENMRRKRVRPKYHVLYNSTQWKKMRIAMLNQHYLCQICHDNGVIVPAKDVDHIVAHRGNEELFYDMSNLQCLCHQCHSIKTQQETKQDNALNNNDC